MNIIGNSTNETLTGSADDDFIDGRAGDDSLLGGAGSDFLVGGAGNDTLDGGTILDRTNYFDLNSTSYSTSTAGINLNLQTGVVADGLGGTDTLININFVQGSNFNDLLTGSSTLNLFEQFEGLAGNDTINGGAVDPNTGGAVDPNTVSNANRATYSNAPTRVIVNLSTGVAQDGYGTVDTLINITHVRGSNFNDVLTGSDTSVYTEGFEGRAGNDIIDGKGGNDQVRYEAATSSVNVNLVTGIAQDGQSGTDNLLNIEGVRGSNFNDVITGGNPANGTGATDGFEFFQGNAGNDTIDGGAGYDRVDYNSSTSGVSVTLGGAGTGTAQDGLGGTDTLINIEGVRGSDLNDVLTGSDTAVFESFDGRAGNDTIDGRGGIDRADYSSDFAAANVNLTIGIALDGFGGTDTLINIENVRGSAFNDTLVGNSGNNFLEGRAGNDTLTGGAGDDRIDGGAGDDRIDGGSGIDMAVYQGGRSGYTVTKTASGWTVGSGSDGVDTLQNVERLKFSDTTVALDIAGNAGQAYRVYQAAFNRTPDSGGLGFWINTMDGGASLRSVAEGFVKSAEYIALYGTNPTNTQIVNKLYENVLGRQGEIGGLTFWLGVLDSKADTLAGVLAAFSESAENQAGLVGLIGNGFAYTPFA